VASTSTLEGQVALVTGAGRRLGRAIASSLAQAGSSVAVHYNRSEAKARSLCEQLETSGVAAWAVQADLADPHGLDRLLAQAWDRAGRVDVLVNNASIFPENRLADIEFADVTNNMAVNAWAPLALTRALWRRCVDAERQASVVNLLDSRLVGGDPVHAAYFVSKVALAEITRASALEFAPTLRVNGVAPGPILPPEGKDAEYVRQRVEGLPLRRWGNPDQVAEAVVYLACADYVTGQTIFVDGGQHLQPWGA
jgi:NAD(P)-dependent dehydrogenase (short-subunit alcohol dehydrogenase family)